MLAFLRLSESSRQEFPLQHNVTPRGTLTAVTVNVACGVYEHEFNTLLHLKQQHNGTITCMCASKSNYQCNGWAHLHFMQSGLGGAFLQNSGKEGDVRLCKQGRLGGGLW